MPPAVVEVPAPTHRKPLHRLLDYALGFGSLTLILAAVVIALRDDEPVDRAVSAAAPAPDFASIPDASARKRAFFDYLAPMVSARNDWIREQRSKLASLRSALAQGETLGEGDAAYVDRLADQYRIDAPEDGVHVATIDRLLQRCDVIPPALALAQAASESAWGTSRFARQGNNYFGEWCFEEGCGIVPASRAPGKTHEVEAFPTAQASVASYFRNLNRVGAYQPLRERRAQARAEGRDIDGRYLAGGLEKYSELGETYVKDIRSIIAFNELDDRYALRGETPELGGS